jgi:predicted transcriptional regulator
MSTFEKKPQASPNILKGASKIEVVSVLPDNPEEDVLYFITE